MQERFLESPDFLNYCSLIIIQVNHFLQRKYYDFFSTKLLLQQRIQVLGEVYHFQPFIVLATS